MDKTEYSNIGPSIEAKIGRNLHNLKNHPIEIIKRKIYEYFDSVENYNFDKFVNLNPKVTVENNFDLLLIPKDHVARSKSDTYYVNKNVVLRTHTSAHQVDLLRQGYKSFLVTGDVYRKDEIDKTHYPVFHQMEGLSILPKEKDAVNELKKILSGLVEHLFPGCNYRYNDDYFPFTDPSFEIEVFHNGRWLEILGCGITQQKIVEHYENYDNHIAWAFGLGLERLAMILFEIPDIRIFWATSEKFLSQYSDGKIRKFVPYSNVDSITKDISFFINSNISNDGDSFVWSDINDFYDLCREHSMDMLEKVDLYDKYHNKKRDKYSHTFRLTFSPAAEIVSLAQITKIANKFMLELAAVVEKRLDIELR